MKLRGQKAHGLVTGWQLVAEVEDLCSGVGEKVREAGLAPGGSDLHMLSHPASRRQGFRQSHFQEPSAPDPEVLGVQGGATHGPCVAGAPG